MKTYSLSPIRTLGIFKHESSGLIRASSNVPRLDDSFDGGMFINAQSVSLGTRYFPTSNVHFQNSSDVLGLSFNSSRQILKSISVHDDVVCEHFFLSDASADRSYLLGMRYHYAQGTTPLMVPGKTLNELRSASVMSTKLAHVMPTTQLIVRNFLECYADADTVSELVVDLPDLLTVPSYSNPEIYRYDFTTLYGKLCSAVQRLESKDTWEFARAAAGVIPPLSFFFWDSLFGEAIQFRSRPSLTTLVRSVASHSPMFIDSKISLMGQIPPNSEINPLWLMELATCLSDSVPVTDIDAAYTVSSSGAIAKPNAVYFDQYFQFRVGRPIPNYTDTIGAILYSSLSRILDLRVTPVVVRIVRQATDEALVFVYSIDGHLIRSAYVDLLITALFSYNLAEDYGSVDIFMRDVTSWV